MTESLPTSSEVDVAIVALQAGELSEDGFFALLSDSQLMLAVVSAGAEDGRSRPVVPFVIQLDGRDYGVGFTNTANYEKFTASTSFVVESARQLARGWPTGLGLALNPGAASGLLLAPEALARLAGAEPPAEQTVPAGTELRIGAPDPGLPDDALEVLRRAVQRDDTVAAAYQLAFAQGEAAPELVVGVEPARPGQQVAEQFASNVVDADPRFRGLPFLDLTARLLAPAQELGTPLR